MYFFSSIKNYCIYFEAGNFSFYLFCFFLIFHKFIFHKFNINFILMISHSFFKNCFIFRYPLFCVKTHRNKLESFCRCSNLQYLALFGASTIKMCPSHSNSIPRDLMLVTIVQCETLGISTHSMGLVILFQNVRGLVECGRREVYQKELTDISPIYLMQIGIFGN